MFSPISNRLLCMATQPSSHQPERPSPIGKSLMAAAQHSPQRPFQSVVHVVVGATFDKDKDRTGSSRKGTSQLPHTVPLRLSVRNYHFIVLHPMAPLSSVAVACIGSLMNSRRCNNVDQQLELKTWVNASRGKYASWATP